MLAASSGKLAIFSSSHLILGTYLGLASGLALAEQGWVAPLLVTTLFALVATVHVLHTYDGLNQRFRAGLRRAAAALLRAELRHSGGGGADAGLLGACHAVELEARTAPGMLGEMCSSISSLQ